MRSECRLFKSLLHAVCCWRRSRSKLSDSWFRRHGPSLVVLVTLIHIFFTAPYSLSWYEYDAHLTWSAYSSNSTAQCSKEQSLLKGFVKPQLYGEVPDIKTIEDANKYVSIGGEWKPTDCMATDQKLAIIITYRQRWNDLQILLAHLHPFLQRQRRHYRIFIVEQAFNDLFNQGRLANIGYTEAQRLGKWDCIIFHDVDIVPLNDYNLYECGNQPRHLSPARDDLRYHLVHNANFIEV